MSMKEIGLEPKFISGEESGTGWSQRVPWTDEETILICLDNCRNLAGLYKNQVERIIKERMEPPVIFPNRLIKNYENNSKDN